MGREYAFTLPNMRYTAATVLATCNYPGKHIVFLSADFLKYWKLGQHHNITS